MSQENVEVVKRAIARTSTNWTAARLVRVRVFFDRQEALEAAGLQE